MAFFTGTMLAMLAVINASYSKSYIYPPFLFSTVWAFLLLGLAISGDAFYPLSPLTLIIYLLGALAFSTGGMAALVITGNISTAPENSEMPCMVGIVDKVLNWGLVAQLVIAPLYLKFLMNISSLANVESFLVGVRMQTSTGFREDGFGIFSYAVVIVTFLALTAFYEMDTTPYKKRRAILYIIIALTYQLLSAARTGAVLVIGSLFILSVCKTGKVNLKALVAGAFVFLLVFSIPAILLNKGGSSDQSTLENVVSVVQSVRDYTLPSLVAFDREVREQQGIGTSSTSFRFIFLIANQFGANIEIPSTVLEYTATPVPTNLYTMYYYYYKDFGLAGTLIMMFFLGSICTFLFTVAQSRNPAAIILYSMVATSLVLSGVGEPFLSSASFWIQAILFVALLYGIRLSKGTLHTVSSDRLRNAL